MIRDFVILTAFFVCGPAVAKEPLGMVNRTVYPTAENAVVQPDVLQRGEYLFRVAACGSCHTQDQNRPLAGGPALATLAGTFYPPNISKDANAGIGRWTDAQFIRALRKGMSPQGRRYFPSFPFQAYTQLTDADMIAIKRYIFSLRGFPEKHRPHELRAVAELPLVNFVWRGMDKMMQDRKYFNQWTTFMQAEGPFRDFQNIDEQWNRGAYLVEGALHCGQCHTPRTNHGHLVPNRRMGGSSTELMSAPNITTAESSLTGSWKVAEWDLFLRTGEWGGGGVPGSGAMAGGEMARVIKEQTSVLTASDRAAVIRYLMALPAVESE